MKKGLTKLEMKSIKPKEKNQWKLKEGEEVIEKEEEIANIFNNFFIEKFHYLKMELIKSMSKNHLPNLGKRWNKKNIKFSLKTVTEKLCTVPFVA